MYLELYAMNCKVKDLKRRKNKHVVKLQHTLFFHCFSFFFILNLKVLNYSEYYEIC